MHTIDLIEARTAALKALEEVGDHTYQRPVPGMSGCTYTTPGGSASCIVGHVVQRIAPTLMPEIRELEWRRYDPEDDAPFIHAFGVGTLVDHLSGRYEYSDAAIYWLSEAQRRQDDGNPWSEAIKIADQCVIGLNITRRFPADEAEYIAGFNNTAIPEGK